MLRILAKLYSIGLLRPRGLWALWRAVARDGVNLMAVLHHGARRYGDRLAIDDGEARVSYRELYDGSLRMALAMADRWALGPGMAVAIAARNHVATAQALCACARLGVDTYLLNVEMGGPQLRAQLGRRPHALVVHADEVAAELEGVAETAKVSLTALARMAAELAADPARRLPKAKAGRIVLLSGGTSGNFKAAPRKPSPGQLLYPALAMLMDVGVDRHRSVYVATPIYHGYGLSAFMIAAFLGLEMHFLPRFDAGAACARIARHRIEGATLVPLMLRRMLAHDTAALGSLRCILSGGAPLSPELAKATADALGDVLFNLYGTSESGFSLLARPAELAARPGTIGRPIRGVRVQLQGPDGQPVPDGTAGMLCLHNKIEMEGTGGHWLPTGDVAVRDADGYYHLRGRSDHMIVSGGENVFPEDLEQALAGHPEVGEVAVVGVEDAEYGQRLLAYVAGRDGAAPTAAELREWLSGRVARYQMPREIVVLDALPMTATGKVDRRKLASADGL